MNESKNEQTEASRGLDQMMDELNKNDKKQLEQLARQLRELLDELKRLKQAEEALNKDSIAAGDKAAQQAMVKLGDRQGQIQMNTIVVQKKAESTKNAAAAAGDIGQAGEFMSTAAAALYGSKQPAALEPETKAIAALDEAIKKLEKEQQKDESQLKEKDVAELVKHYEMIKKD